MHNLIRKVRRPPPLRTLKRMPELPEAERARLTLEAVLGRRIAEVDDRDTYVCRPHPPGQIADALVGHRFVTANRRGKMLWLETEDGPVLALHLGMTGHIVLDPEETIRWDRFTIRFQDGGGFALRDKRRLGRAFLDPSLTRVGPDAAEVTKSDFRRLIGAGRAPIKARLLDQKAISGVGNLLADQMLWQARLAPARRTDTLSVDELDRLRREVRAAVRSALRRGGAHTGALIAERRDDGVCPRDGHPLQRARIGGRTTYWCPACQI
jgi:formamidopyrimidine-DNA glycosylase